MSGASPVHIRSRTKGSLRVDSFTDWLRGNWIEVVDECTVPYAGVGRLKAEDTSLLLSLLLRLDKIVSSTVCFIQDR